MSNDRIANIQAELSALSVFEPDVSSKRSLNSSDETDNRDIRRKALGTPTLLALKPKLSGLTASLIKSVESKDDGATLQRAFEQIKYNDEILREKGALAQALVAKRCEQESKDSQESMGTNTECKGPVEVEEPGDTLTYSAQVSHELSDTALKAESDTKVTPSTENAEEIEDENPFRLTGVFLTELSLLDEKIAQSRAASAVPRASSALPHPQSAAHSIKSTVSNTRDLLNQQRNFLERNKVLGSNARYFDAMTPNEKQRVEALLKLEDNFGDGSGAADAERESTLVHSKSALDLPELDQIAQIDLRLAEYRKMNAENSSSPVEDE